MVELLLILVALALVAACGAFVAAEFSLITVDRPEVERAAEAGDGKARGVLLALKSLSTQLSAAQVGITVTNLLIGFLAEPAIADLISPSLESLGLGGQVVTAVALAIALVLATGMTMVFGELVPKNLAIARPLATARAVQGFQRGFTRAAGAPIRFLNTTANHILRRMGFEPQEELASARSAEELTSLVRRSAREGTLEPETATLLERTLAFGERRASDVMTPRVRMDALGASMPVLEVFRLARETGHSRFPVLEGEPDRPVGVVHVKHAMRVPHEQRATTPIREAMEEPTLVPSTLELDPLLETLRRGGLQLAIVVDEFGEVDGIVTLEDLVEEIVGEVRDEHDPRETPVLTLGPGRWSVSGLLRPDEVADATGVSLPEDEDYETIAGLLGLRLERVPEAGDALSFEVERVDDPPLHVTLTVLRMDGLRVDRVRMEVDVP